MRQKIREKLSIITAKRPSMVVLLVIFAFNIAFILLAAIIISSFALTGTEDKSFIKAAYYTITMILDAGCIDNVITDIGKTSVGIAICCLIIIVIGMISFTGAVIGYITNYISNFVDNSNAGERRLTISDHTVILNWNTRASEIVNDLLYCDSKQNIVVLVSKDKQNIEKEIRERLADTVSRENDKIKKESADKPFLLRVFTPKFKNTVTYIVREGDVFSSKQLHDICLEKAKSIIILGDDINNTLCKYEQKEIITDMSKGNPLTIKSLMQVADITASDDSADDQKIVVEISDDWTAQVVDRIIDFKRKGHENKCNIVPVHVNKLLGQLLSQFSIMPELNRAYSELFSNQGATFYPEEKPAEDEIEYIGNYLENHTHAIPLTVMENGGRSYFYYSASSEKSISKTNALNIKNVGIDVNTNYTMEQKNVVILGHNSKCDYIMKGFQSFVNEWSDILQIMVIDTEKNLEKANYYKEYDFVKKCVTAEIYDNETVVNAIEEFVNSNDEDTSVLILSDDSATNDNIDANVLANLIYVQEIIERKKSEDPHFDEESIDVIAELIDPKHHDIVNNYSVNNVIISNRYISKMITQIGEKDSLYSLYTDILAYDDKDSEIHESKEIYTKKVSRFFDKLPVECNAAELIREVFKATTSSDLAEKNPTLVLGYVKPGGKIVLFEGDQTRIPVKLESKDKIIVFSNH